MFSKLIKMGKYMVRDEFSGWSTKFLVENPWNETQNSTMDYDKLIEYFEVICAVKVKD